MTGHCNCVSENSCSVCRHFQGFENVDMGPLHSSLKRLPDAWQPPKKPTHGVLIQKKPDDTINYTENHSCNTPGVLSRLYYLLRYGTKYQIVFRCICGYVYTYKAEWGLFDQRGLFGHWVYRYEATDIWQSVGGSAEKKDEMK